jgi:uncharacterized RDD family membrane protein YckC
MPELWGKRFFALLIDVIMVTLFLWVIIAVVYPLIAMANIFSVLNIWIPIAAILIIVYFTYFEGKYATTPGKNVMKIKVEAIKGKMGYSKAFIRNLSKILWLPLIIDVIIGLFMGKPRRRCLDRLAKTRVVKVDGVVHPLKDVEETAS